MKGGTNMSNTNEFKTDDNCCSVLLNEEITNRFDRKFQKTLDFEKDCLESYDAVKLSITTNTRFFHNCRQHFFLRPSVQEKYDKELYAFKIDAISKLVDIINSE